MYYKIRKLKKEECYELAHFVAIVWNETYKGIVDDDFLDNLYVNEKERGDKHYNRFNEEENHVFVLEMDKKIVGFINVGISEDKDFDNLGEIYALYIMKKYHGYGLSKVLIDAGIDELKSLGCDKMVIACLKDNPTNSFYQYIGGKFIKNKIFEKLNLLENVYYFDRI